MSIVCNVQIVDRSLQGVVGFELVLELISIVNNANEYVVFSLMRLPHKHVYTEGGGRAAVLNLTNVLR